MMDSSTSSPLSRRSHQVTNIDLEKINISKSRGGYSQFTPPTTPLKPASQDDAETRTMQRAGEPSEEQEVERGLITFDGSLKLEKEIGRGAWSKVFAAREQPLKTRVIEQQQPLTPPASPANALAATKCFAVKVPSHSLALSVIRNEAHILSKLTSSPSSSSHIVRFYGLTATNCLVLSRASETLSSLAKSAFCTERNTSKLRPSADPVIGLRHWFDFAVQLARGLAWMHSMGVVHGDIKPSNILLLPTTPDSVSLSEEAPLKAVYCDFSSARLLSTSPDKAPNALPTDALTTSYASPELLKAYSRSYSSSNPVEEAVATEHSDVWALAVTLVVTAVGEDPYAHTGNDMRKLAMAKEGLVLDGIRMGEWTSGMRVKRDGLVERAVRGALMKRVEARLGIKAWAKALEDMKRETEGAENVAKN